jgi:23S rRNA-/tRNA-specific pseudouridylate synthase
MSLLFPIILAQGEKWLAVSKPAGWLTIPGRGEKWPVLSEWLERESAQKIWVVHRIDRETSGVVLFAKTAEAHREASLWFENQQVKKAYDFLASGNPSQPVLKLKDAIEGKPSMTQIEVKERYGSAFLGRAIPLSGRRHQIRIHLSKSGYPILGDEHYQGPKNLSERALRFERVALHAARLELPSGEKFEASWPEDFSSWIRELRS